MKDVKKISYDGYKYIDGGVCAAKGFRANGLYSGIKANPSEKYDLCLVVSDVLCNAAGVFTQNKVQAAPVTVSKSHLKATGGKAKAFILNSKNANACNPDGIEKSEKMCSLAAERLCIPSEQVLIAQTGVIGQTMPIEPIENNIDSLVYGLSENGNEKAAIAIMTTDTVKKEVAVEFTLGGKVCHLGGMGKGSGMICPNMATTLNVITTDCAITSEMLQKALSDVVKVTYNCLYVDGDQSTNDTCAVMANGLAENSVIDSENEDYAAFKQALYIVMSNITKMLAKDGEGATKLLECNVTGAKTEKDALAVAKSVISSDLLKCAMFASDANVGRIACAIGYADADFDPAGFSVVLESSKGSIKFFEKGAIMPFSEDEAAEMLSDDEIKINVTLSDGDAKATAWGCDLTYEYIKINADYRT
ncbi:MAG: bifunctional glutamate N-acetyltransferase/amino-acid acetyltransferase ArgJ [Oscillospiraceae bacterium]|nr:bifunctional glutamate N-acetyltransferase/amino-acid acetyltransferase ArgJ [Oscillospiraceae bacterium]